MTLVPQLTGRAWTVFGIYLIGGLAAVPELQATLGAWLMQPATAGWLFIVLSAPAVAWLVDRLDRGARDARTLAERLIASSDDGILLAAPDGGVLAANPAMCRLSGYSEAELISGGRQLIVDEDDPELQAMLAQRRAVGHVTGELWLARRDGGRVRVEVSSALFEHRGAERAAMIVRDVTDRHYSAYCMRLADAAFQTDDLIVVVLDTEWRVLWANRGAQASAGRSAQARLGKPSPFYTHLQRTDPAKLEAVCATVDRDGIWTGELETVRVDGSVYPVRGHIRRLEGPVVNQVRYVVVFSDRSAVVDYEERLQRMALHDPVTGLPNRKYFERRLEHHLTSIAPLRISATVILVDLDHFVAINELRGHRFGDAALCQAAERLQAALGPDAIVVRHAGSGFFAYAPAVTSAANADGEALEERVVAAFREPLEVRGERIRLPVSVGSSVYPRDGNEVSDLMRNAEAAVQLAKDRGGDNAQRFTTSIASQSQSFVALATALRDDLAREAVQARFQLILDAATLEPVDMEALARWHRPERGWVPPSEFIPVAERAGLIDDLAALLLRHTCDHLRALDAAGLGHLGAAMNLSPRQLQTRGVADGILRALAEAGVDPRRLTLEITESLLMQEPDMAQDLLRRLRSEGIRVVLDDFGMGYSSLGYLKWFEVDGIKIDRAFIANLPHDDSDAAILRAIMAVARELQLSVVAEGVERQEQADYLRAVGCARLQGFLFGAAMPSAALVARCRAGARGA